ncbi:hypothetical protein XENOCAPTIV_007365, partial [Xenoophorus captivus]
FLLQKGRCLNVSPDFSAAAEECLSRAVKLDPTLVEAWNILGDQYWKKGDLIASKNCFTGALQQEKNKVSLRNLSMVLRQLPAANSDEHSKRVLESVDLAREAGKVKTRRLRTMLSNLNTSALGPCSAPQFRSPSGRVGSLEPRSLSSLTHGHNAGVAALGKVVFSLASQGRMAL